MRGGAALATASDVAPKHPSAQAAGSPLCHLYYFQPLLLLNGIEISIIAQKGHLVFNRGCGGQRLAGENAC